MDPKDEARRLHGQVNLVGLRAQATAVGFLQLCTELVDAGVLDDAAMKRIQDAIADDVMISHKPVRGRDLFELSLRRRLAALFPKRGRHGDGTVGRSDDMQASLGLSDGEAARLAE